MISLPTSKKSFGQTSVLFQLFIEVADGNAAEGRQYRYIVTAAFPFYLQCYRGNIRSDEVKEYKNGKWEPFSKLYDGAGKCDINDFGYDESCFIFDQSYAEMQLCGLGNCIISPTKSRPQETDLSKVYFSCAATSEKKKYEKCEESTGTTPEPTQSRTTGKTTTTVRPTISTTIMTTDTNPTKTTKPA